MVNFDFYNVSLTLRLSQNLGVQQIFWSSFAPQQFWKRQNIHFKNNKTPKYCYPGLC
jgi:hypothetical protein